MPRSPNPHPFLTPQEGRKVERELAHWNQNLLAREVARAVFLWRQTRLMTQRECAEVLQMTQPQVARIESGEVNPSLDTLARISLRLRINFAIEVTAGEVTVGWARPEPEI
jgi:transcriptional regulator with XRE-family HTH domain